MLQHTITYMYDIHMKYFYSISYLWIYVYFMSLKLIQGKIKLIAIDSSPWTTTLQNATDFKPRWFLDIDLTNTFKMVSKDSIVTTPSLN